MVMTVFIATASSEFHWPMEYQALNINLPDYDFLTDSFQCSREIFSGTDQTLTEQKVNSQQNNLTQKLRSFKKKFQKINHKGSILVAGLN